MTVVKKTIKGKRYNHLPAYINVPRQVTDIIIDYRINNLSKAAMRVLLILIANIKEQQIHKKDVNQLELFDEDWYLIDNDKLYTVQFSFKFSDFLPKGNKNYAQVKKGLEELQSLKYKLPFSIPNKKTGKVRNFTLNSNLISSYLVEENRGFKITIDKYWYRIFINLASGNFNQIFKNVVYNIKSTYTFILYFYLKKLPYIKYKNFEEYKDLVNDHWEVKIYKGTIKKTEDFINDFKFPYKHQSEIIREVLEPARQEMHNNLDISFNYKFHKDNINIICYPVDKILIENKTITSDLSKIRSSIQYKVKKYELNKENTYFLIELYLKYSYPIILKATDKKRNLVKLKGKAYYDEFYLTLNNYVKRYKIKETDNDYRVNARQQLVNQIIK